MIREAASQDPDTLPGFYGYGSRTQPACDDADADSHRSSDREAFADYEHVASEGCDQVS